MSKKREKAAHPLMLPDKGALRGSIASDKLTLDPGPDALTRKKPAKNPAD